MTRANAVICLSVSLAAVAISQITLKASLIRLERAWMPGQSYRQFAWLVLTDPANWMAVALMTIGVVGWYLAMLRLPLSLMLPMSGFIAPVVTVGAWAVLGETLSLPKIAAIVTIAAGVAWLGWLNT